MTATNTDYTATAVPDIVGFDRATRLQHDVRPGTIFSDPAGGGAGHAPITEAPIRQSDTSRLQSGRMPPRLTSL
jgi:hypothetical protein